MKGTVYVVTHKKYTLDASVKTKGYTLISVGKGKETDNEGVHDDTGENIASKNTNYCELTALYWIWKNDQKSEYKGLCHYRRYITMKQVSTDISGVIGHNEIHQFLQNGKYDIILPQKQHFIRTAAQNFLRCGFQKDLDNLRKVIGELYPDYLEVYDRVWQSNVSYLMNMMIAPKETFDAYCKWLFDILFALEKITDLTGYSVQEARIYGYLSERLLTVWVIKNQLHIKELPFINTEEKQNGFKKFNESVHLYQTAKDIIFRIKKMK